MSILDYLMGSAPTAASAAATVPPADAAQAAQGAMMAAQPPAPPVSSGDTSQQQQVPTSVSGVTVTAQHPPLHYDNSQDVAAVQKSLQADAPIPGGTPGYNPGIWGLLPSNIQHGTLRNVLGGLGDAFLMMDHRPETYRPRMEQQLVGNAMAGYANNPQAAIERVGATGVPGSDNMAMNMENAYQNRKTREASLAQTNQWHEDTLEQRRSYEKAQTDARNQSNIQRMSPYIGGLAQTASDLPSYHKVYNQAESMAQRIGPEYHAADFGLPDPKDWQPGMMTGMTGGQIARTNVSEDSINERGNASQQAHQDRMYHYQHPNYAPKQPTAASLDSRIIDKLNRGEQLLPGEAQYWQHRTASHGGRPILIGGSQGGQQPAPQTGTAPTQQDIQFLQHNPQYKQQFINHFGKDVAAKYGIK